MPRRRTLFTAPLVFTAALTPSCSHRSGETAAGGTTTEAPPDPEVPTGPPGGSGQIAAAADDAGVGPDGKRIVYNGYQCLEGPPGKESTVKCPESLLPEAPPGTAVAEVYGDCRTLGQKLVRCPATIVLPEPSQLEHDGDHVGIDTHTFGCHAWRDMHCPRGASCNPPPPRPVECPPELVPRLAAGVQPTARKDGHCLLGDVIVVCPAE